MSNKETSCCADCGCKDGRFYPSAIILRAYGGSEISVLFCTNCLLKRLEIYDENGYQPPIGYKIKELLERKNSALMSVLERIMERHHKGYCSIDKFGFEMIEVAKSVRDAHSVDQINDAMKKLRDIANLS